MPRIISTHSFRGGTGKSNTTANLASLVAHAGFRVAVIDTDIQSPGIHVLFGFEQAQAQYSLNDYLWKKCSIEQAAYDVSAAAFADLPVKPENAAVYLVPSSLNGGDIAKILRAGYDVALLNDGIQELLQKLRIDYLFIDTHPGVNEETLLSIAISDTLVLVMRPDNQDFQGTAVTAELARRLGVPEIFIVVNKVPPGGDNEQLRQQVEEAYKAEVIALLPLSPEVARLASRGIFAHRFPSHPVSEQLRQVARRLRGGGP
ncbi:MAG: MinD/ParA family protein [Planctomycetota bacterium]